MATTEPTMATTYPAAVKFAAFLPLEAFATVEPVGRELYGTTTYVVDEAAARTRASQAGPAAYFDEVRHHLQRRVDALNARNA